VLLLAGLVGGLYWLRDGNDDSPVVVLAEPEPKKFLHALAVPYRVGRQLGGWKAWQVQPRCPDGTRFIPGTDGYAFIREGARHNIDDFCLDTTEVTVKAFRALSEESFAKSKTQLWPGLNDKYCNARYTNREDHPMNCVDWEQASTHCGGVGGRRLPTEWEWEWAARGRDEGREYPWGSDPPTCDRAIFSPDSVDGCKEDRTWPVGSLKPESSDSKDGLHDMSGNVWEWTSSSYDGKDAKGSVRVLRGGGWDDDDAAFLRVSYRGGNTPTFRSDDAGFRCARTPL